MVKWDQVSRLRSLAKEFELVNQVRSMLSKPRMQPSTNQRWVTQKQNMVQLKPIVVAGTDWMLKRALALAAWILINSLRRQNELLVRLRWWTALARTLSEWMKDGNSVLSSKWARKKLIFQQNRASISWYKISVVKMEVEETLWAWTTLFLGFKD